MKFESGHGFQGIILYDENCDKIQCHLCGDWFQSLSHHISRFHKMKTREYRLQTGLLVTTPLSIPSICQIKSKEASIRYYTHLKNKLRNTTKIRHKRKMRMQEMNRKGTCPLQLEEKIEEINFLNGKIRRKDVPSGLLKAIYSRYGTWNRYLTLTNRQLNTTRLSDNDIKRILKCFVEKNKYFPTRSQMNNRMCLPLFSYRPVVRIFGSLSNAQRETMKKV